MAFSKRFLTTGTFLLLASSLVWAGLTSVHKTKPGQDSSIPRRPGEAILRHSAEISKFAAAANFALRVIDHGLLSSNIFAAGNLKWKEIHKELSLPKKRSGWCEETAPLARPEKDLISSKSNQNSPGVSVEYLSGILVHEAIHTLDKSQLAGSSADERMAYEYEADFLCCAIDYVHTLNLTQEEKQKKVDDLCDKYWQIANAYCNHVEKPEENQFPLCTDCASEPPCMYYGSAPIPPSTVVPRSPLALTHFPRDKRGMNTPAGFFQAYLEPARRGITMVRHLGGGGGGIFFVDLSFQAEGTFLPFALDLADSAGLFIAGRIEETGLTAIYRFDFSWSPGGPVFHSQLIYMGQEIGDVVSLVSTKSLNGSLAVFDYTWARISYVKVADGDLRHLVDFSSQPELLQMQGMVGVPTIPKPEANIPPGYWFSLQPNLPPVIPCPSGIIEIDIIDRYGDGTVDEVIVNR
ncbi:MAG: hypothetical protein DWQ01_00255 [Planctomycetota bacterium]|nr:MAG: hypothetical protein DWQ01_00255 [Planctomycetota bacterium]